jgi:hypothetical protein
MDARELRTNKTDLEALRFPGGEPGNRIVLPPNLAQLGNVTFQGKFTGFYDDFVAYGNLTTAIGYISSDINLKYRPKEKLTHYSGHLAASNFNAGSFWSLPDVGTVSFNVDVKGSGMTAKSMSATLDGVISSLHYKNYEYTNLALNAAITKQLFNGMLAIHEPNADFDFTGKINFQGELPVFNFTADIKSLQLDKLHCSTSRKMPTFLLKRYRPHRKQDRQPYGEHRAE